MKHYLILSIAALMGFVCLVSCSELESDLPSSIHQIRIVTHTREGEAPLANVYLFNAKNTLVRTIQTDAAGSYTTASASVKLSADTYTLCALNTSDLAHFQIPDHPTPTSVITKAANQTMGDLLMATASTSLSDGASDQIDMTLQRKVLRLSAISISQVPADVTGVSVSIAPFYSGIQFNGTYVETNPATCTFDLVASTTTGLWQLTPDQFVFPSKGIPTITITFARVDSETSSYTYTANESLTANNKYNISGTYTEPLGVTLAGTIALQPWPTDPTPVDFDFDEQNASNNTPTNPSTDPTTDPSEAPVTGQIYKGCYVVSVDESNHTAVLLSPTEIKGYNTETGQADAALTLLNNALKSWITPAGISGTWRIPNRDEFDLFAQPADILIDIEKGKGKFYYCMNGADVNTLEVKRRSSDGVASVGTPTFSLGNRNYLRPVIDITY